MTFAVISSEKTLDRLPREGEWTHGPKGTDYRKIKVFERPMVFGARSAIGDGTVFKAPCVFVESVTLFRCEIAAGSYIGPYVWLRDSCKIGRDCLLSPDADLSANTKIESHQSMIKTGKHQAFILPVYGGGVFLVLEGSRYRDTGAFMKELQDAGGNIWQAYTIRQAVLEASKKLSEAATYPRSILAMKGA